MSNRSIQLHAVNTDQLVATRNALPVDVRHAAIEALNGIVVHMIDVALAAKHAHWNVRGPNFLSHHKLFDEVFSQLIAQIDSVGERATALGGIARGTVQMVANGTDLKPYPVLSVGEREHVEQLSERLGLLGAKISRAAGEASRLGDIVSADVLTDAAATIDSLLWLVESHASTA